MKAFSNFTVYGIRALMYLVSRAGKEGSYVSISEVAKELNISFHFLTKIFQALTQRGMLVSYRGPKGGIAFNKPVNEIKLIDIIYVLEGEEYFNTCVLNLPDCRDANPCPVHQVWSNTRRALKSDFEKMTLAEIGENIKAGKLRLTG